MYNGSQTPLPLVCVSPALNSLRLNCKTSWDDSNDDGGGGGGGSADDDEDDDDDYDDDGD